jgi:DNA topoisomerase IB
MRRLRTVSASDPGWRRVRHGRGFSYLDEQGLPLAPADRARVESLVIPPAWTDVWVCPYPRGHLQAVGTDAAGRRQYLYHEDWRRARDEAKFDRVLAMAAELPRVRRRLDAELAADTSDRRVLAMAVRLIDLGCFRVGSAGYTEENGSYGLTTLERRHVRRNGLGHVFTFVGKSGVEHRIEVADTDVCRVLTEITRRRRGPSRLLVVQRDRRWVPVSPAAVNEYLGDLFRAEVTAKDFRTWHGTVRVAASLGAVARAATRRRRDQQVRAAIVDAAEYLGNTPAVARSAYVDPRVLDLFEDGTTIAAAVRRASPDPRRRQDQLDRATVKLLG